MQVFQRRNGNANAQRNGNNQSQQPAPAPPFPLVTKPTVSTIGTIDYAAGQQGQPLRITQAKLLSRLFVTVTATLSDSTATTIDLAEARAPYNLIERLQIRLAGSDDPINISGWELYQWMIAAHPSYIDPDSFDLTDQGEFKLHFEVPITVSRRDLTGLIMMQARSTNAEVIIDWADPTDVVTTDGDPSFSGSAQVLGEFFEIPRNRGSWPDLSRLHQVRSFPTPINNAGINEIFLPTGDVYQRLQFHVISGGALDDTNALGLQNLELDYSQSYTQFDLDFDTLNLINAVDQGNTQQTGVYTIDLSQAPPRDYLDTSQITDLKAVFDFANAPPANSSVVTVVEQLVRLT